MHNFSDYILDLSHLVSYKSVRSTPLPGKPFGEEVFGALEYFLSIAKKMSFETINYDGYIGEVIFGEGEEIGIIGHLDVVPVGIGWDTDPFTLTEKGEYFYGRGVQDDKAPLLACLYALKELKDSKIPSNKKFRLIVGCDEESGWEDVKYMKQKTSFPEYGFSPDGNFPLSYAEKGICEVKIEIPKLKRFHDIKGGVAVNVVCDRVTAVADPEGIDENLLRKHGLSLKDGFTIESVGKAAHGSAPFLGKNALLPLFNYFLDMGEDVKTVIDKLFYKDGTISDVLTEQGYLTFSPDQIWEEDDKIYINCDCRIPAPKTLADVIPIFNSFGLKYTTSLRHEYHYVPKEGEFVQTLLNAHNKVMGENLEPVSLGGSTFARAFKMGCSFGPMFKLRHGNIHDANEHVLKTDLINAYNIYKEAIFALAKQ